MRLILQVVNDYQRILYYLKDNDKIYKTHEEILTDVDGILERGDYEEEITIDDFNVYLHYIINSFSEYGKVM